MQMELSAQEKGYSSSSLNRGIIGLSGNRLAFSDAGRANGRTKAQQQ